MPTETELCAQLRHEVLQSLQRHRPGSYWPRTLRMGPSFCSDIVTRQCLSMPVIAIASAALVGLLIMALCIVDGFLPHTEMTAERMGRLCSHVVINGAIASFIGQLLGATLRRARPIDRAAWLKVNAWLDTRPDWLPVVAQWMAASHDELIGRDAHAIARAVKRDADAEIKAAAMAVLLKAGFSLGTARFWSHPWTRRRAVAFATWRNRAAQRREEEKTQTHQAFHEGPVAAALDAHHLNRLLPSGGADTGSRRRL